MSAEEDITTSRKEKVRIGDTTVQLDGLVLAEPKISTKVK